jgi:type IV secretory pathway VirB10-like protein
MASTERIFFAGVATTVLLIGTGFSGGVMLGKAAVDVPAKAPQAVALQNDAPPPTRVILPVAAVPAPSRPAAPPVQEAAAPTPLPQANPESAPEFIPVKDVHSQQQNIEKEKQAAREAEKQQAAEQRKKAADRERHKRYAAQKARQEVARKQQEQQQQLEQQDVLRDSEGPRILAYDREDAPNQQAGFFGN